MKGRIIFKAIGTILFLTLLSGSAKAFNLSIGGNLWYSWWFPSWQKNIIAKGKEDPRVGRIYVDLPDYKLDPSFLFGPLISMKFKNIVSIGSIFMYGYYSAKTEGVYASPNDTYTEARTLWVRATRTIKKYDSDTTVAYHINSLIKVFAGFKYQGYDYSYNPRWISKLFSSRNPMKSKGTSSIDSYGPGLGIGFTARLIQNFIIQANLSGLILWGNETTNFKPAVSPVSLNLLHFNKGIFYAYGGNANIAFLYFIDPANTTVSLGFRYQILRYEQKENKRGFSDIDNQYDHFFGFTCTVLYTINFKKKERKKPFEAES